MYVEHLRECLTEFFHLHVDLLVLVAEFLKRSLSSRPVQRSFLTYFFDHQPDFLVVGHELVAECVVELKHLLLKTTDTVDVLSELIKVLAEFVILGAELVEFIGKALVNLVDELVLGIHLIPEFVDLILSSLDSGLLIGVFSLKSSYPFSECVVLGSEVSPKVGDLSLKFALHCTDERIDLSHLIVDEGLESCLDSAGLIVCILLKQCLKISEFGVDLIVGVHKSDLVGKSLEILLKLLGECLGGVGISLVVVDLLLKVGDRCLQACDFGSAVALAVFESGLKRIDLISQDLVIVIILVNNVTQVILTGLKSAHAYACEKRQGCSVEYFFLHLW